MSTLMFLDEQQDELLSEITTATVAVENLINLRADVQAIGGVSRNDIEMLDTYSTGMVALESLTNTLPDIRTFTQSPSLTNFSVATESIVAKIKAAIKWLVDKVVAFFRWIGNKLTALWQWVTRQSKNHEKEIGSVKPEELSDEPVKLVDVVAETPSIGMLSSGELNNKYLTLDVNTGILEYKPTGQVELDALIVRLVEIQNQVVGSSSKVAEMSMADRLAWFKECRGSYENWSKSALALDASDFKDNKDYAALYSDANSVALTYFAMVNASIAKAEEAIKSVSDADIKQVVSGVKNTVEVSDETVGEANTDVQDAMRAVAKSTGVPTAEYISATMNAVCPVSHELAIRERYGMLKALVTKMDKDLSDLAKVDLAELDDGYEFPTVSAPKFTVVLETVNARYNELATPREFTKFYQNKILKSSERKSMMDKIGKLLGDMDKLSGVFNITLSALQTAASNPQFEAKHDLLAKIIKVLSGNLEVLLAMTNEIQFNLQTDNAGMAAVAEIVKKLKANHRKK